MKLTHLAQRQDVAISVIDVAGVNDLRAVVSVANVQNIVRCSVFSILNEILQANIHGELVLIVAVENVGIDLDVTVECFDMLCWMAFRVDRSSRSLTYLDSLNLGTLDRLVIRRDRNELERAGAADMSVSSGVPLNFIKVGLVKECACGEVFVLAIVQGL